MKNKCVHQNGESRYIIV